MIERSVQQRGSQSGVGLHIIWSLRYLRDHHVGLALGNERRDFLVLLMDDDSGMRQVLVGELLIQSTGIYHHTDFRLVDVGQRLVAVGLRCTAKDGLSVSQIALAHQHRLAAGIGNGDAANGEVELLRLYQHICRQRRPRGWNKLNAYA